MPARTIPDKPIPNPTGFCMCGCGSITPVAEETNLPIQRVKGEHIRYILGHSARGKPSPLKGTGNSIPRHKRRDVEQMRQWRQEYAIRNPERVRLNSAHQSHLRRLRTRDTDITVTWLLELRTATINCVLCAMLLNDVDVELDHIVPLNVGGKHVMENVRFICKTCNRSRPRNGSDVENR